MALRSLSSSPPRQDPGAAASSPRCPSRRVRGVPDRRFDAPPGRVRAYQAEPGSEAPWPGVVLIHELFGLNDDLRAKADRFASRGYLALAPDLFSTEPKPLCVLKAFRALRAGKGEAFETIEAARAEV